MIDANAELREERGLYVPGYLLRVPPVVGQHMDLDDIAVVVCNDARRSDAAQAAQRSFHIHDSTLARQVGHTATLLHSVICLDLARHSTGCDPQGADGYHHSRLL